MINLEDIDALIEFVGMVCMDREMQSECERVSENYLAEAERALATARAMKARIAELEAALAPFAKLSEHEDDAGMSPAEQWFLFGAKGVTYGDLRRARAALKGSEG
jgi:hypothetical protein